MPVFITMEKQYEDEDEPRQVRVVKSAYEKVWSKEGWSLPADPQENVLEESGAPPENVDATRVTPPTPPAGKHVPIPGPSQGATPGQGNDGQTPGRNPAE